MADAPGPHLDDEVPGVGGDPTHRERHSDLGVVGPDRGDRGPGRGEHGAEQVLGARLARRAGDADDLQVGTAPHDLPGQGGEGVLGVVDDHARDAVHRPRGEHGDGSPGHGIRHEVVAVGLLADPGDVQPAGPGLTRVGDDGAVDDERVRVDAGRRDDGPTDGLRDLGHGERDHSGVPDAARCRAWASSARSSKGCTTPAISWPLS